MWLGAKPITAKILMRLEAKSAPRRVGIAKDEGVTPVIFPVSRQRAGFAQDSVLPPSRRIRTVAISRRVQCLAEHTRGMAIAGNGWYERAIPSASLALKARTPAIYGSRPYAGDPSLAPHGTNLSATESSRNRKISAPRSEQALDQSLRPRAHCRTLSLSARKSSMAWPPR